MRGFVGINDKPPSPPPPKARHSRTSSPSSTGRHRNKLEKGVELTREPWLRHRKATTVTNGGGSNSASSWTEDQSTAAVSSTGAAENGRGVSITMGGANSKSGRRVGRVGLGGSSSNGYEEVEREEPLLEREEADALSEGELEVGKEQEMTDSEIRVSSGLLWSAGSGDNPNLRSRGDTSLGPAFGSSGVAARGSSMTSLNGLTGEGDMNGDPVREEGSWAVSGRPLVYLCAVCSSLCSILLGYDVGVMSGAKEYIKPDLGLSQERLEGIVGSLNIVAAFGGLLAGKTADRLGRKPTTALACLVFIAGATIMTLSDSFFSLLMGRVVTGVGVGCAMVIAPVYITELAPPDVRGMLVSLTDICINIGIVLGYAASLVCDGLFESDSGKWRSMIGIGMVPPALILFCLMIMPESPRWLICAGRESEALVVLKRVLGNNREATESLRTISQAMSNHEEATWRDVLLPKDRVVKAAMFVGLGLGFWQQASGSEAAVYYTPEVLEGNGWDSNQILLGNIGVGGFKLLGEVVAFMLLDRLGRRPLFLASSILVTLCLVMVGNTFLFDWPTEIVLFWLCMFMFCFSLGLGPVTFVVASEMFPVVVRGKAMSVVICVNRLMSGAIALSYESMTDIMTSAGSFYFFSFLSAVSVLFYAYWVPETSGRTLEEITADLASSSPSPGIQVGRGGARHYPLPEEDDEAQ